MRLVLCRKFVLFANADVDLNKNGHNAKIIIKTVCAILENKEKSGWYFSYALCALLIFYGFKIFLKSTQIIRNSAWYVFILKSN